MSATIEAQNVTAGMIVDGGVLGHRVQVTSVRNNVRYYARRVTMVHGRNEHDVLVEIVAHPEYEFVQA